MSAQPPQSRRLSAEGQATLARLSASVEAALACLMEYEAQQAAVARANAHGEVPQGHGPQRVMK